MAQHDPEIVFVVRDAECTAETTAAIRVRAGDLAQDIWIPKSVLHDDSEVYEANTEGELVVMRWWAKKEGLL